MHLTVSFWKDSFACMDLRPPFLGCIHLYEDLPFLVIELDLFPSDILTNELRYSESLPCFGTWLSHLFSKFSQLQLEYTVRWTHQYAYILLQLLLKSDHLFQSWHKHAFVQINRHLHFLSRTWYSYFASLDTYSKSSQGLYQLYRFYELYIQLDSSPAAH